MGSQAKVSSWYDFPSSPCKQWSLLPPSGYRPMFHLDKAPVGLVFQFELTNKVLAWEPQSTPPMDMYSRSCLPLCLPWPPLCGSSRHAMYFLQDLWVISLFISLVLVVSGWTMAHHLASCISTEQMLIWQSHNSNKLHSHYKALGVRKLRW